MSNISKISVDGATYDVKDIAARETAGSAQEVATIAQEVASDAQEAASAAMVEVNNKLPKSSEDLEVATAVINFRNGVQIGGIPISYDASKNRIIFG
jgi:hypothetical protein